MTDTSNDYHQQIQLLREAHEKLATSSTELEADIWYRKEVRALNNQALSNPSVETI